MLNGMIEVKKAFSKACSYNVSCFHQSGSASEKDRGGAGEDTGADCKSVHEMLK